MLSHSLSDPEASLAVAGLVFVIALLLFCFCYLIFYLVNLFCVLDVASPEPGS